MLHCRMAARAPASPPKAPPDDPLVQIRLSDLLALRAAAANGGAAPAPEPEFLNTREAAELLGVTPKALEQMRSEGRGPRFVRVGRAVRYRRSDLAPATDPSDPPAR